ncbi:MAG: hypothetical protein JST82_14665 [Bacteroidetes bacterium]|nr:hypothetical protein [Bacteroidota bacterium]
MKPFVKKLIWGVGSVLLLSVIVLGIHIYMVTRPGKPDANTRIMARIDFKQDINQEDAAKIYSWLSKQVGVDRVMCSAENDNVLFTYAPLANNADKLLIELQTNLHYKAKRYMPSPEEMKKGCPVSQSSPTYKVYNTVKNIF